MYVCTHFEIRDVMMNDIRMVSPDLLHGRQNLPVGTFFAPGRVNLIGDHTDYNGGLVFPAALTLGTFLTVYERVDHFSCGFQSENEPAVFELGGDQLHNKYNSWVDYPLGVLKEFSDQGFQVTGYDFRYKGNLPIGAALSSSASIEVVTAFALNELLGQPFTLLELVQMAQHAENNFVGMNCGIMDQFASGFGKQDHAIALDCNTLQYEWVPLDMAGLKFVIANTNKKRGLVNSAYNQRRSECRQALDLLRTRAEIQCLCQLTNEQFDELSPGLLEGKVLQRARHTIREHQRVREAVEALKQGQMERFGSLMNESHDSLRDDYEVTCPELDFLAMEARNYDGVLGSRMTGAGFGGCTVTLLREPQVADFIRDLGERYCQEFGIRADFYVADIGDGAAIH